MNNSSLANSVSGSVRLYRALLVIYPKKFRDHYETHMVQVFRDSLRDAHHRYGMAGVIDVWIHTFADLFVTALAERMMERSQYMVSPKVSLWGGWAGAFSGLFWVIMGLAPSSAAVTGRLALVLGLGGLVGLYSRQVGQGGRLRLAGFAFAVIGTLLWLETLGWGITSDRISSATIANDPVLAAPVVLIFLLPGVTLGIGLALLGVGSLRTKTLPRWRALLLGLGLLNIMHGVVFWKVYYVPLSQGRNPWNPWPPEGYLLNVAVLILLGLGWMALGSTFATEAEAQVVQPPPASTQAP